MPATFQEKRSFYRHPINAPIRLKSQRLKEPIRSEARDLSLGGLSFFWGRRMSKGELIEISIAVKDKQFEIRGRVAYSKEDRKSGKFRTGVVFVDSPGAFRAKLAEEALEILEYRKVLSRELGRDVSEEEAAREWIKKFAGQFPCLD